MALPRKGVSSTCLPTTAVRSRITKLSSWKSFLWGLVMTMSWQCERQTRFGEKYIMLVDKDDKKSLCLCYSSKQFKTYLRENLSGCRRKKSGSLRDIFDTVWRTIGRVAYYWWGRTPERNIIVYCNMCLTRELNTQEELTTQMEEDCTNLKDTLTQSNVQAFPLLVRESMVRAVQEQVKFGRITCWFYPYCDIFRLHRTLWRAESCCQVGGHCRSPSWGWLRRTKGTLK